MTVMHVVERAAAVANDRAANGTLAMQAMAPLAPEERFTLDHEPGRAYQAPGVAATYNAVYDTWRMVKYTYLEDICIAKAESVGIDLRQLLRFQPNKGPVALLVDTLIAKLRASDAEATTLRQHVFDATDVLLHTGEHDEDSIQHVLQDHARDLPTYYRTLAKANRKTVEILNPPVEIG